MNAVDTNVFVYFFDDEEPAKQAQATALLDQLVQPPSETVLLWQVAGELLSWLRRWQWAGNRSDADVNADIRNILAMFPWAFPTKNVILRSLDLSSRYSPNGRLFVAAARTLNGSWNLFRSSTETARVARHKSSG